MLLVIALSGVFVWSLQRRDPANVGFMGRVQEGTCIAWINAIEVPLWGPVWANAELEMITRAMFAWAEAPQNDGRVNLAIFLNEATAREWNAKDNPTMSGLPAASFQELTIESPEPFAALVSFHNYGSLAIGSRDIRTMFGLSSDPSLLIQVGGSANSQFTLQYDRVTREGVFGDRVSFSKAVTGVMRYPETVWFGTLTPTEPDPNITCHDRAASNQRSQMEIFATLGSFLNSPLQERGNARFTLAIERVFVSGVTGSLSIDGGQDRTIGPEDSVEVSGDLAQLTVDTQSGHLEFVGNLNQVQVNDDDIRGIRIDTWPWYTQAAFWSAFAWAAVGAWLRLDVSSLYHRVVGRKSIKEPGVGA